MYMYNIYALAYVYVYMLEKNSSRTFIFALPTSRYTSISFYLRVNFLSRLHLSIYI